MQRKQVIIFILILCLAAYFRFTGLNWDAGTHLHPDERFLTMVATNLEWPTSVTEYFDTAHSPLNPHNKEYNFYVYGTWPVIFAKAVAQVLGRDSYDGFPMVGRALAALADLVTVIFVFLIAKTVTKNIQTALLAAFLYSISVLPVQLSHFFAVDPFATLFLTISLYLLIQKRVGILLGVTVGLALSAKISGMLILPLVALSSLEDWPWRIKHPYKIKRILHVIFRGILCILAILITVRIAYPYLFDGFHINPLVIANWKELKAFDGINTSFPPALQWIGTIPILYPLMDMITWGLGLPLGILTLLGVLYTARNTIHTRRLDEPALLLFWILIVFGYQSIQFAKPLRYMAPIYPALAVLTALFLSRLYIFAVPLRSFLRRGVYLLIGLILLWPLSFLSIYRHPPTRVTASEWIYDHIPPAATIAWESWDDPLPLHIDTRPYNNYPTIQLPMYDPESPQKWNTIVESLSQTDYLVLSSNRVYGSTNNVFDRFPQTSRYYRLLFSGELGFTLVAQFTERPTLPLPFVHTCIHIPGFSYGISARTLEACNTNGIAFVDDYADETFTVYDHPKVLIFEKTKTLDLNELLKY